MSERPSPWAPPDPSRGGRFGPPPPRPRPVRDPLSPGVLALVVVIGTTLVAGITTAATLPAGAGGGRDKARTPEAAMTRWLDAARDGDPAAITAAVAPSQRERVDPADPLGLPGRRGMRQLTVDLAVSNRSSGTGRPDEALVEVVRPQPCAAAEKPCFEVQGTGPRGSVLMLREQGSWYAVARPLRLTERVRKRTVEARVSQVLELTGFAAAREANEETIRDRSCATVGLLPFTFSGIDIERSVYLLRRDDHEGGPPGDTRVPASEFYLLLSDEFRAPSYVPTAPVLLRRARDNSSGEMSIVNWKQQVDGLTGKRPDERAVSGKLSWTCRTVFAEN